MRFTSGDCPWTVTGGAVMMGYSVPSVKLLPLESQQIKPGPLMPKPPA